jgi:threonyl-tRNA synthetase
MKDSLGRDWQMGTIQLDFQLPRRFSLKYSDKDGTEKTPVVIHRVIYGSFERFIGIITEHFAGSFPLWLSPTQVRVIPISEKFEEYSQKVLKELKENKIRSDIDLRNETLGARVRDAQNEKIPYMIIIGQKEQEENTITLRKRNSKDLEKLNLPDFINLSLKKIHSKSLEI